MLKKFGVLSVSRVSEERERAFFLACCSVGLLISSMCCAVPAQSLPSDPPPAYSLVDPFPRGRVVGSDSFRETSFQEMRQVLPERKLSRSLRTFLADRSTYATWSSVQANTSDSCDKKQLARLGLKFFKYSPSFFEASDTNLISNAVKPFLGVWRRFKLEQTAFLRRKGQALRIRRTYGSALRGNLKQQAGLPITVGELRQNNRCFSWLQGVNDSVQISTFLRDEGNTSDQRACAKALLNLPAFSSPNFALLSSVNGETVSLALQKVKYRNNFLLRFLGVHGKTHEGMRKTLRRNLKKDLQDNRKAFASLMPESLLGRVCLRLAASAA